MRDPITDADLAQMSKPIDVRTPWKPMGQEYYDLTGTDPLGLGAKSPNGSNTAGTGDYVQFRQDSGFYSNETRSNPIGWVLGGIGALFTIMSPLGWFLLAVGGIVAFYVLVIKPALKRVRESSATTDLDAEQATEVEQTH